MFNTGYNRAFAITPSDTVAFTQPCNAIYVGVAGNIAVLAAGDAAAVVFKAVPAGTVLLVRAKRVNATLTTATDLVGLGVN